MSDFSSQNDFQTILNRLLANVDDSLDKRQGSIIYDALAPAAAELAQCYIALDVYTDQTYLLTTTGENLDNRVADYGISRNEATYAKRIIEIYNTNNDLMNVDIGTRFSVPNDYGGYNYTITEQQSIGNYIATCETAGTVGNEYIGELLPLTYINNLGKAVLNEVYIPGEDEETDEQLRERTLEKINQEAFAGNKAAYKRFTEDIEGVEIAKIFPVWNGGGSVKVSIIASNYQIPSSEFISQIQEIIDPIQNQGEGIGIAPIGHTVTVEAPTKLDIDIEATLSLQLGYEIEQVKSLVEEQIQNYIREIQDSWSDEDTLVIFHSKIIAAILTIPQVKNVSSLTINDVNGDFTIELSGTNVKFPMLNEVILNEN